MQLTRFKAPLALGLLLASTTLFGCSPKKAPEATAPAAQDQAAAPAEGDQAATEKIVFTLKNGTNAPMVEFYVSPPKDEQWGESLIPAGQDLGPGEEATVTINDGLKDCKYDLKAKFGPAPDGSVGEGELFESGVEICDGATYTYSR